MNIDKNQSLIEIALEIMKSKRKARTIEKIIDEVFQKKGYTKGDYSVEAAQFEVDFMLCGFFVVTSEDKNGDKLWDLKTRVPSSILDKEGAKFEEDLHADDEDVVKHELTDDIDYIDEDKPFGEVEEEEDDDEEEEEEGLDDIEEELALYDDDGNVVSYDIDEFDEDEDLDDDDDK